MGTAELARGAHARAREHHAQVLKLYDPTAHAALSFSFGTDPAVTALGMSSMSLWLSGWPQQAWSRAERSIARAHELAHPLSLVTVLPYVGWVQQFRGELDQAWVLTQTLVTLEREHGFTSDVTRAPLEQGIVWVQRGELAEGIKLLTEGLVQYRPTGSRILLPYFLSILADAYGQQGKLEEGLKVIAEAVQLTETNFSRFWAAEVYRIKGELSLQSGQVEDKSQASLKQVSSKSRTSKRKSEYASPQPLAPKAKPKHVFTRLLRSPASKKRSRWSYGR